MSQVFVIDSKKQPLSPVQPGYARKLLSSGRAAVWRHVPFTIILKCQVLRPSRPPLRLKLDPGSKATGLAVVNDASGEVVFAAELSHRGQQIKAALDAHRAVRRRRRQRKTRYRKPRYYNRRRPKGWLPPCLVSRMVNVLTWVQRLLQVCPIRALSQELVKFDLQKLDAPEMAGVQYQQGTLYGYEVREYLLEKWGHRCAYCDERDVPLQVEHIAPRARGGSDRVSNLCLACAPCNRKKGVQDVRVFLQNDEERLARLLAQARTPLKDAAVVNSTRWALAERLKAFGLPMELGSGGRTKYNRTQLGWPKTHWADAACVGGSTPEVLTVKHLHPLLIHATGRGSRQMCRMDRFGFPRTGPKQHKRIKGFQTGDLVRAIVPAGKQGRVAVRSTGSFNIITAHQTVQGISHRHCTPVQRCDGYSYQRGGAAFPPAV